MTNTIIFLDEPMQDCAALTINNTATGISKRLLFSAGGPISIFIIDGNRRECKEIRKPYLMQLDIERINIYINDYLAGMGAWDSMVKDEFPNDFTEAMQKLFFGVQKARL